jgi:cell shape-determining protein MreC
MKTSLQIKLLVGLAVIAIVVGCVSVGHPNLVAARQYVRDAIAKVTAAQQANNYDMQGHAARAKRLMEQAIEEINLAEQAANQ